MKKEVLIMIIIAAAIVGAGIFLAANDHSVQQTSSSFKPTPAANPVLIPKDAHMTGSPSAKVQLVEFGDYQCPACGEAYPILKQILNDYKNNPNFNFVFRNFPLYTIHPNALESAEAAEAAAAQGKFWQMHDMLYQTQNTWAEASDPLPDFTGYAQTLGLDVNKFKSDVESEKYQSVLEKDEDDGLGLGVDETPTFFLNGKKEPGVISYQNLKSQIDSLLK